MEKLRLGKIEGEDKVGVVNGIEWKEVGGEILKIEGVMMKGKGRMKVKGNISEVMKE